MTIVSGLVSLNRGCGLNGWPQLNKGSNAVLLTISEVKQSQQHTGRVPHLYLVDGLAYDQFLWLSG